MPKNMSVANLGERVYDPSCVSTYMRCPKLFYWEYAMGLEPKEGRPALEFGTVIHEAMDVLVGNGDITLESLEKAIAVMQQYPPTVGDEKRTRERGEAILRGYYEKYHTQKDFKVLAKEVTFAIPLPNGATVSGRIDLVVEYLGRPWVWDYKTASSLGGHWPESFRPHLPTDTYAAGVKQTLGDCAGVVIDGLLVSKTKTEFTRIFSERSEKEIEDAIPRFAEWVDRIEGDIRSVKFAMATANCHAFYFQACDFLHPCLYGEGVLELKYRRKNGAAGNTLPN